MNIAEKLIKSHLVKGEMIKGTEIGLKIDKTLTQDATGTMAYLQFEAMGIDRVKTENAATLYAIYNNLTDEQLLKFASSAAACNLFAENSVDGMKSKSEIEKMEDIYSFKNPNQESVLNSLLVISGDNSGIRLVAEPVHYLEFCKKYFSKRSILIPMLDIEEFLSSKRDIFLSR